MAARDHRFETKEAAYAMFLVHHRSAGGQIGQLIDDDFRVFVTPSSAALSAAFAEEFRRSGTMGRILEQIPVFLNTNEESGLWGAALAAAQRLGFECSREEDE